MPILVTRHGPVAIVALELPRANAIDFAFVDAFDRALDSAAESDARAVVVTGQGRAFSAGLDLLAADALDREGLARFVDAFDGMFVRLFSLERPVVAAVNGHAIAGGCILAMAADYRVMAPGPFAIGATEVELGLPFPAGAFEIACSAVPLERRTEALMLGERYAPEQALAAGIVHRLAGPEGVVADALAVARSLAERPRAAVGLIKSRLRAPALARIEAGRVEARERFVDAWQGPEGRERIGAAREALLKRRAGGA